MQSLTVLVYITVLRRHIMCCLFQ